MALPEVVVAVIILALILVYVPPVLGLIVQAQFSWSEQRVAESLSRNQMEYVKVAGYIFGNETHPLPEYATVPTPDESYVVDVVAQPVDPGTKAPLAAGEDQGMQVVIVRIFHSEEMVLETSNYKVDRLDVLSI